MSFIAQPIAGIICAFLTFSIAPDLAPLAATCKSWSKDCRLLYCRHCGHIFRIHELHEIRNGRALHADICDWLPVMDPFRFFYHKIPWKFAFVAGGWAAWLHFREHRNHING